MQNEPPQIYSQDYRHFDTLIWQVPSWASAIFALAIAVAGNLDKVETALRLEQRLALSVFFSTVFLVLVLLGNVLVRFRLHQGALGQLQAKPVARYPWQPSGHASLLLIVFIEASALLWLALLAWDMPKLGAASIALVFLAVFIPTELSTVRRIEELRAQRATAIRKDA